MKKYSSYLVTTYKESFNKAAIKEQENKYFFLLICQTFDHLYYIYIRKNLNRRSDKFGFVTCRTYNQLLTNYYMQPKHGNCAIKQSTAYKIKYLTHLWTAKLRGDKPLYFFTQPPKNFILKRYIKSKSKLLKYFAIEINHYLLYYSNNSRNYFLKKADEKKSLYAYFATDCTPYPYRKRLFVKDASRAA